jgi:hypothetical protein
VTGAARVFLLSPARLDGERARLLLSPRGRSALAARLRGDGAPLGEVMTFLSGLYFRGKLAYARAFARPPDPGCAVAAGGVLVITSNAGLRPGDAVVTLGDLRAARQVPIRPRSRRYRRSLEGACRRLAERIGPHTQVVLLGSVASDKYVEILSEAFGERLAFPQAFVGRGDMSRGGLLLRCVAEGRELPYVPLAGTTVRHGPRPPRLTPLGPAGAPVTAGV